MMRDYRMHFYIAIQFIWSRRMGIRDDEIKRLKKYAEGLGIKVYFKKYYKGCGGAEWDMDDQSIIIYPSSRYSKTDIILLLLHELGHHLDWIYHNKKDSKDALRAQELLCNGNMYGDRSDIPKKYRDIILREELAGIHYMDIIHKELDLKIPLWKVKMQQDIDASEYRLLASKGRFYTYKEAKEYKKGIKDYYRDKYGN